MALSRPSGDPRNDRSLAAQKSMKPEAEIDTVSCKLVIGEEGGKLS
jgi:hypothetical protein